MEKRYKPGEFAKLVNRSVPTLRAWDRQGKLQPKRLPGGHRYYTDEDLLTALNIERKPIDTQTLIYGRASSPKQKKDLERQMSALESFCIANGWKIDRTMREIGGGLNYMRPMFLELISEVEARRLNRVVITHKDRLCRFGFDFFEHFFKSHGCELIVMNSSESSPQQELVEDLIAVIHCFSCRLYGLRKYHKEISKIISTCEQSGR